MKMQSVSFDSVDAFIEFLPPDELKVTKLLRSLILNNVPRVKEKLSYNVPFYSLNKGLFFIWPSSVLWGNKKTYEGVRFGFQQGYMLNDVLHYLERGERQQVYWKTFSTIKEIDTDTLKTYIFEAVNIDNQFKRTKS